MQTIDKRSLGRQKMKNFYIQYQVENSTSVFKAEVINLSANGLCFLRNSVLTKKEIIKIHFPFKAKKISFRAEVLRVDGKEVAIKFLEDEDRIEIFVNIFNNEYKFLTSNGFEQEGLNDTTDPWKKENDDMFKI